VYVIPRLTTSAVPVIAIRLVLGYLPHLKANMTFVRTLVSLRETVSHPYRSYSQRNLSQAIFGDVGFKQGN